MEANVFDLVAAVIILLLGLKGILNGFFKELFGLLGIVGGIFVASRVGDDVGAFLSDNIFHFDSHAVVSFSGFLLTLILFWLSMVLIGHLFKKLGDLSGLGPVDRIAGFLLGSGKFFLIASVIAFAANNIDAVRDNLHDSLHDSVLFPIMVEAGEKIMQLDPAQISDETAEAISSGSEVAKSIAIEHADAIANSVQEHMGAEGTK